MTVDVPAHVVEGFRSLAQATSVDDAARKACVSVTTLRKALSGKPLSAAVVETLSRNAPKVREAKEFEASRGTINTPPRAKQDSYSWDIAKIRQARDDQLRGKFLLPVQLARAMRTDDALFVPRLNRLAPLSCLTAEVVGHESARGEAVKKRALASIVHSRQVLEGIAGTLVDHGIAIGYVRHFPTDDGTAVNMVLEEWPLESVEWNESRERLEARTREFTTVPIVHGDGHWIVFAKFAQFPWTQDACVLPGGLVWAAHAEGIANWAGSARSHGLSRMLGELPEGVATHDANGVLTAQAYAFVKLLADVVSGETPFGLRPTGSKTEFVSDNSTAWQVFDTLATDRAKAGARIYQGTDATLGSTGGAPGVDIATLFGVATTRVQGDIEAIERGLRTGLYEPWTAINVGDSRLAPALKYQVPDADADAKSSESAGRYKRLFDTLQGMRDQRMAVTQDMVTRVCRELGISPPIQLAPQTDTSTSTITLAPTDIAKVVRVREARQAQGLPPFGDARDEMTITELDALAQAKATATPATPNTTPVTTP